MVSIWGRRVTLPHGCISSRGKIMFIDEAAWLHSCRLSEERGSMLIFPSDTIKNDLRGDEKDKKRIELLTNLLT